MTTMETKNYTPHAVPETDPDYRDRMKWRDRVVPFIDIPKLNLYQLYGDVFTWERTTKTMRCGEPQLVHTGTCCMLGVDYTVVLSEEYWSIDQSNEDFFIPSVQISVEVGGLRGYSDPFLQFTYPDDDRRYEDFMITYARECLKEAVLKLKIPGVEFSHVDSWSPNYNGKSIGWEDFYAEMLKIPEFMEYLVECRKSHKDYVDELLSGRLYKNMTL